MAKSYNLNLSADYIKDWGAWEVAREIICNAIDADPEGMSVEYDGGDKMVVATTTCPELAELIVIGQGTKSAGGDTIGQFGEGFKMAALAATRKGGTGAFVAKTPQATIQFKMRAAVKGVPTLHAVVEPFDGQREGFTVEVAMPDIRATSKGKIDHRMAIGPIDKQVPGATNVYVKGVYITTIMQDGLWDWNIENITLNRDRDSASEWQIRYEINRWLENNATLDQARQVVASTGLEAEAIGSIGERDSAAGNFRQAWFDLHGEDAVLATGYETDHYARAKGVTVVVINTDGLRRGLQSLGIKTSATHKVTQNDFEAVGASEYERQIKRLRGIAETVLKAPAHAVRVFSARNTNLYGRAESEEACIWLSEALFQDGRDQDLCTTYFHELAHLMSAGAGDASMEFEAALDRIAGAFALKIFGGRV